MPRMSSKIKIPTLTSSNYVIWRAVACAAIHSLNGQMFIERDGPAPRDHELQKVYWEIIALLTASVSRDLLHLIATETANPQKANPFRIWKAIENHFNPNNTSSIYKLKVEFFAMKLERDEEVTRFISKIEETACRINAAIQGVQSTLQAKPKPGDKEREKERDDHDDPIIIPDAPLDAIPDGISFVCKGDCLAVLLAGIESEFPVDHAVITRQKSISYEDAKAHIIERCRHAQSEDLKTLRDTPKPSKTCRLHGKGGHSTDECRALQKQIDNLQAKSELSNPQQQNQSNAPPNASSKGRGRGRGDGRRGNNRHLGFSDTFFNVSHIRNQLIIDSGCSRHICGEELRHLIVNKRKIQPRKFYTAEGRSIEVCEEGDMVFELEVEGRIDTITLSDVALAPIRDSFISVAQLVEKGVQFEFSANSCTLRQNGEIIAIGQKFERIYLIPLHNGGTAASLTSQAQDEILQTHIRLGHANAAILKKAATKGSIVGMDEKIIEQTLGKCPVCLEAKARTQNKNPTTEQWPTTILHRLHVDRSGPHKPSLGGNTSYQLIVDAASRYVHVDLGKDKSKGPQEIQNFVEKMENLTGERVRVIRTDGAAEYNSHGYKQWLEKKGIVKETSAPYCQSQNGLAERNIQTLNNMATCLLIQAGLPPSFWAYAVTYAARLRNSLPTKVSNTTPYEQMFKKKPDLSMLHTFGCEAWAHIPKQHRGKFTAKAHRCIFLGFADNHEAFLLRRTSDGKLLTSRDVNFRENIFPSKIQGPFSENKDSEIYLEIHSPSSQNFPNREVLHPDPFQNIPDIVENAGLPILDQDVMNFDATH